MARSAKVAVSMDAELLAEADRVARRRGQTRSAIVGEALRSYLDLERRERALRRYLEALREVPETEAEIAAIDPLGVEALAAIGWQEP